MQEIFRFTITGIIPSKKNEHEIRINKKDPSRVWIAPSSRYQLWEHTHALELMESYSEFHRLPGPLAIEYIFHPATLHRFDASNKIESINDMLVSSQIFIDDNIFYLSDLHPHLGEMSQSGELEVAVIIFSLL